MIARVFDGVLKENVTAARRAWERLGSAWRADRRADVDNRDPAGIRLAPQGDTRDGPDSTKQAGERLHKRLHRRIVGGLTAALAVLALTYSAASALVSGATVSSTARSDYATVMQAASAEYRRARAECLSRPFERRDACIAEAHASEARMRNAATTAPRKQLSQLRQKSDRLLLAAQGLDSIVLEPACHSVARGSASVCAIQVRGSTLEGPEVVMSTRTEPVRAAARMRTEDRSSLAHLLTGAGRERDHYFANVAALVAP